MAKVKTVEPNSADIRPAVNPEVREQQLINYAVNLAEKQLREGTASSQVITHYLKAASVKNQLEIERLQEENKLLRAKTEALQSAKHVEELYADAIKAMKRYSGQGVDDNDY